MLQTCYSYQLFKYCDTMRVTIWISLCFLIVLGVVQSNDLELDGEAFSRNLIKHLFTNEWMPRYVELGKPNVLVSPFSLKAILMTILDGASGESLMELARVLGFEKYPLSIDDFSQGYNRRADDSFKSGARLHSANKIFISNTNPPNPNYVEKVRNWYKTETQTVNFAESKRTENLINQWVEQQTNHRITRLVTDSDFDRSTTSILASTLYFSGRWHGGSFSRVANTFYLFGDVGVNKTMLYDYREARYKRSKKLSADILELTFDGEDDVSMLFFLPNQRNGLAALQKAIAKQSDVLWSIKLPKSQQMAVVIPEFNIESSLNLRELLSKMGVKRIFEPNAQLDRISPGVHIENVLQKLYINVTADGVEAAAASGLRFHHHE
ncbi:unnamed protein product [Callosobruchus maculatus]|uniref:Serpin domain-containing protein n=1 Tax=Callosobruchus maculatus TaxID=64391 RepID=A0A653D487_CALMS|nr:unnamed protein product [Callosobruchus maculatus]